MYNMRTFTTKMSCVIYNRVSSMNQNSYGNNISLQVQESICGKFASENNLNVSRVYKEVHSVFNKIPDVLNNVVNLKKYTILIADVSRFSRSVIIGFDMAKKAIDNNNQLIFIQENLVCSTHEDLETLKIHLKKSEDESKTIANRIKNAKTYLQENGMYSGGTIPYGYYVDDKKLIIDKTEKNIIKFIQLCQNNNISASELNDIMINIHKTTEYEPIECYDKNGKVVSHITEKLFNTEIADLLNSYNVDKRGRLWNANMVKTAILSATPDTIDTKFTKMNI
jgi:DNA invertase Pin-like site-specific DNA recombinase